MTYARKMAHRAQDMWLNGPGGHYHALVSVEAVVAEVIERCAKEAEDSESWNAAGQRIASRIRALATTPAPEPGDRKER